MAKWKVIRRMWSLSRNCYWQPGDIIELSDDEAALLVSKGWIEPAESPRSKRKRKELSNDSNH